MKKYYILDKEKAEKGEFYFLGMTDTLEEAKEQYENYIVYYGELPPDMYYYYDDKDEIIKPKTPKMLLEEGHIKLVAGQRIVGDVIHEYEQPSKYHIWNGDEWIFDLDYAKKLKIEELKNIRDYKESENLEVEGSIFQVTFKDLQKFFLKKIEFDLGTAKTDNWRLADNTYKEIDFQFIKKILEAYGARQRKVFKEFGMLEYRVNNCNSIEDIEAITWE